MKLRFSLILVIPIFLSLVGCDSSTLVGLQLSQYSVNMMVGDEVQLEVIHLPIEATPNNKVSWKSSDINVASVNSKGIITAVYSGSCVITAYCGEVEAKCTVEVSTLNYDVAFSNAIAYVYGDEMEIGANHIILRLFEDGMSISETGSIVGNGFFMNLDMYVPFDDDIIPSGSYVATQNPVINTYIQGAILEESGTSYATGTYLGYFSDNGLSALFLKSGTINIERESENYSISLSLYGEKKESVNCSFNGLIDLNMQTGGNETEVISFQVDTIFFFNYGKYDNVEFNVARIQLLNNNQDMLRLDAYVPLSITDTLPMGIYTLGSYLAQPYRLIPGEGTQFDGCWYNDNTGMTALQRGTMEISKGESGKIKCSFSFYDMKSRLIQSVQPQVMVLKQKL